MWLIIVVVVQHHQKQESQSGCVCVVLLPARRPHQPANERTMKFHYLYLVAVLAFLTSAAWAQDEDEISVTNVDTPAAVAISSSDIQYLDCATDVYYSNLVVGDNSSISDNNDHHDWSRHDL